MKPFFISTAIPYVNAAGHLGHALEFVQADVIARYQRILGNKVFFLTGTDENSLKNVRAAETLGISPQELVDKNSEIFRMLGNKELLDLSWDDFIRTTEVRHFKGAQKLWLACKEDIYKKAYRGLYCVGCEAFYEPDELENELCPEHRTKPELVQEENYFFKLSKYEPQLINLIESNEVNIMPASRRNEVLSFIKSGLKDICISRSAERAKGWGIPVPGDSAQIIWVWFDALPNYINALGYGEDSPQFKEFWGSDGARTHIIGKGIIRFHAVYWLAMLRSARIALPSAIFVHGYINSGGQKMSKSLGNVINPVELIQQYGTDAVRYFLLREIPSTEDGDFTEARFKETYNANLANGLGNLVSRILTLADKFSVDIPELPSRERIMADSQIGVRDILQGLDQFEFKKVMDAIWASVKNEEGYTNINEKAQDRPRFFSISSSNTDIETTRPFANSDSKKRKEDITNQLIRLWYIAIALEPLLPGTSEKIQEAIKNRSSIILFPRQS